MYWIYLTIFVLIVLVPELVQKGVWLLTEEQTEAISIFLLGVSGFIVFLWLHDKFQQSHKEKKKIEQQATQTARDLSASYSYIGSVNRKVDIMLGVILYLPQAAALSTQKDEEIYKGILDAIHMIAKTDKFAVRFISISKSSVRKEVTKSKDFSCSIPNKRMCEKEEKNVIEENGVTVFRSPYDQHDVRACIIICKKMKRTPEDDEFIKALAAQAILLYMFHNRHDEP
jgi:preprotein translocase subunit Sss1